MLVLSTAVASAQGAPPEAEAEVEAEVEPQAEVEAQAEVDSIPEAPTSGYAAPPGYGTSARPTAALHPGGQSQRRRARVPYADGMTIPPGGSLVTRYRRGFLIPGLIGFAATYAMSLLGSTAADEGAPLLAIPLAGFPIWQVKYGDRDTRDFAIPHTLLQAASLALLIVGLIPRRYVEYFTPQTRSKADRNPRWALTPHIHRHGGGVVLTVF